MSPSDQPRLRDAEATRRTAQLLSKAVEELDRPWPAREQDEVLRQIQARVHRPRSEVPRILWGALVASVLFLAVSLGVNLHRQSSLMASGARSLSLGSEAQLTLSAEAQLDLPPAVSPRAGRRLVLRAGRVCASVAHRDLPRDGPLFVEAPSLRVVVIGTKFCVSTENGVSTVSVTEGRIRAEALAGATAEVGAGESLRSDDARLAAAPVLVPPLRSKAAPRPTAPECAEEPALGPGRACSARVAVGGGLGLHTPLCGLALLVRDVAHDGAAALADLRAYEERFPDGVFLPEVSLSALAELLDERRYPEALAETNRALAASEEGGRPALELLRAQLIAYLGRETGVRSSP